MSTPTVGAAWVEIRPDLDRFGSELRSSVGNDVASVGSSSGRRFGDEFDRSSRGKLRGVASGLKGMFGIAAGAAAGLGAISFFKGAIEEATEAEQVTARTSNVIESMGNVAGISADQVADLAGSISSKVGVDDEAIQSGQNLLLTFGNIRNEAGAGNDIFNQTTGLMVDMSTAMGTDMKSSAVQLGKALNDPIKGVSALSRVGVSFTEQQKEQIAALVESGDMMGAQKIILGEVEKQFGGAAESMTTPAQKAEVAWGNLKEQIGTELLPILNRVMGFVTSTAIPAVSQFVEWLRTLGARFSGTGRDAERMRTIIATIRQVFTSVVQVIRENAGTVRDIILGLVQYVRAIWERYGDIITRTVRTVFRGVREVISGLLRVIRGVIRTATALIRGDWRGVWNGIKDIVAGVWQAIRGLVRVALGVLVGVIRTAGRTISTVMSGIWDGVKRIVSRGVDAVVDAVRAVPGKIRDLASRFKDAGKAVIGAMIDGLKNAGSFVSDIAGNVWDAVRGMLNAAIDKINSALEFTIDLPGPKNLTVNPPNIPTIGSNAQGTPFWRGGWTWVGEEGPELLNLPRGSRILPNGDSMRMASAGGSGPVTVSLAGVRMTLLLEDGTTIAGYVDERITTGQDLAAERSRAAGRGPGAAA